MPVLNGKAYWASISNPNTTFEPVWSIDLAVDSANKKKAIEGESRKTQRQGL